MKAFATMYGVDDLTEVLCAHLGHWDSLDDAPRIEKVTSHEKIAPFTNFVQMLFSEEEVKEVVQAIG